MILLGTVLILVIFIRFRLLATPLERDEGEYAYIGQQFLKGISPFANAYSMKLPGTSLMYALIMFFFGESLTAIHFCLLIVNITTAVILFFLCRRTFNSITISAIAAASFALTSILPGVVGFAAHATHFVVLFALTGFLLFDIGEERNQPWIVLFSGLSMGLSFIMKQSGIFFIAALLAVLLVNLFSKKYSRQKFLQYLAYIFAGFCIPLLVLVSWIAFSGNFGQFWLWTVLYSSEYNSLNNLTSGIHNFNFSFTPLLSESFLFWLFVIFGAVSLLFIAKSNSKRFSFIFTVFSLSSILPGMYFREHYFILLLPACSILASLGFQSLNFLNKKFTYYLPSIAFSLMLIITTYSNRQYFFFSSPETVIRNVYKLNPFPESLKLAQFLSANTSPEDRIQILGSEPQIYFYANRTAASGYIYMYELVEKQPYALEMQKELIADIENNKPKYIVFCNISESWLVRQYSERTIFQWSSVYVKEHYSKVGIIDFVNINDIRFIASEEIPTYIPSNRSILIFQKNQK